MRAVLKTIAIGVLLVGIAMPASAATFTFGTLPSDGTIAASAGDTIGWGYTITNNSPLEWLVASAVDASGFNFGTPDSTVFDFPIVAPLTTVTVPYDPIAGVGLFRFTWDADAFARTNAGIFRLHLNEYFGDPFNGGQLEDEEVILESPYLAITAPGTPATPAPIATPEPGSLLLTLTGMGALVARRRRRPLGNWVIE